ncbi:MAG: hypothetical protein LBE17_01925 [Treponema sp.]|jgi:hypothetical protein|nr:hypothetical protein [Treponema sp.]
MKERKPLVREFAASYRAAQSKVEKSKILNDFISAAGYNRKYAIGIPGGEGKTKLLRLNGKLVKAHITHKTGKKRVYTKRYGPDTAACVVRLRDFFKGMCGRRLVPSSGQTSPSWPGNRGLGLPKTSGGNLFG